jgi:hypothetical protein
MRGDRSAYDVLGLEPDADLDEIDRAYRRLIKRYHPDRTGGDAARAADINRAYRELRGRPDGQHALVFHQADLARGSGRGWVHSAMAIAIALAALLVATGPVTALIGQLSQSPRSDPGHPRPENIADAMDLPIHDVTVLGGAREALRLTIGRSDGALVGASRDCYRQLRQEPSVDRLDRCAAFDDAVVQLQDRDPMWDGGPFSPVAVTGRQWSAAAALSNDYLAVDGRLDRIRLQVELALAPRTPPPAGAPAQR